MQKVAVKWQNQAGIEMCSTLLVDLLKVYFLVKEVGEKGSKNNHSQFLHLVNHG